LEQHFVDLISSLPLHVVLLLAILGLWRDNRRLHAKVEDCLSRAQAASQKIDAISTILPVQPSFDDLDDADIVL